ncbi:PadR family transcriptional regulator [Pontibacillus halophilus JSM 076056 = DSM 19796]|uniref:PadR family transcriptional regulator n=1 Tax=Pontibacillus halophilus JSM 076056 = DSM 19796 TaxID=1385510 RepID=A0A0A5GH70_9BACI|nr:PadR family transcriptional regulator [Pontibacillus halophilus]KGX91379.1 PadR family transcriptional regulator [Pontibacillus halophilus JSM 076056 = DSM 19796]
MNNKKLEHAYLPMSETAFYILLSLTEPRHGYGIIKHVEHLTKGRILLGSGTVYGTLTKMQKNNLIAVYADEKRKKVYEMTDSGRWVLEQEMERIKELYRNVQDYERGE